MKKTYKELKENARNKVIDEQLRYSQENISYLELFKWQSKCEKIAKRYGLTKEFKENGIL